MLRIDMDSMRRRSAFIEAWRQIENGDVDIILGTQMIAKGFHLDNVTLVGVPLADVSLHQPDFRCAERAFSLLTQVSGRTGRGVKGGQVIIQTYVPYHYAVEYAKNHDFIGFYEKEIQVRRVLRFPPFARLISVLAVGDSPDTTQELMGEFSRMLRTAAFKHENAVVVLGPTPAPIARLRDQYRWRLLLRGTDTNLMKDVLHTALTRYRELRHHTKVQLVTDVDPQDLL